EVNEDFLLFPGHANIVAIKLKNKVVVVDAGRNLDDTSIIRKKIETFFNTSINTVVITHFHSDHTHSIPIYADYEVVSSDLCLKYMKAAKRKVKDNHPLIYPNNTFTDEYSIEDNGFKVVIKKTGGHTPDSAYVYSEKHKLLVAGDNLRSDFLWGGRGSDLDQWIEAFEEYLSFDIDYIIPGHGHILRKEDISQVSYHLKDFKTELFNLIKEDLEKDEIMSKMISFKPKNPDSIHIHESTIRKWVNLYSKNPI
ncbi:MAG: MBL fold metallo-hydrolase, partial [Candidatus Hodarchaeota archaeon]